MLSVEDMSLVTILVCTIIAVTTPHVVETFCRLGFITRVLTRIFLAGYNDLRP